LQYYDKGLKGNSNLFFGKAISLLKQKSKGKRKVLGVICNEKLMDAI
jgi:hypothetical protein